MTDSGCRWRSREGGARTANLVRTFPYSAPSCRERLSERQLEGFSIVGPWLRKPQRRGQGTPFCRLTGLQFGAYPDFSDSLRRRVLGSSLIKFQRYATWRMRLALYQCILVRVS
jgi:hypothetical protein